MILKLFVILIFSAISVKTNRTCGLEPVFRSNGDLRLSFIVNECSSASLRNTLYLTSSWICERLNVLEFFGGNRVGLDIYNTCNPQEMIDPIVDAARSEAYNMGKLREAGHFYYKGRFK